MLEKVILALALTISLYLLAQFRPPQRNVAIENKKIEAVEIVLNWFNFRPSMVIN